MRSGAARRSGRDPTVHSDTGPHSGRASGGHFRRTGPGHHRIRRAVLAASGQYRFQCEYQPGGGDPGQCRIRPADRAGPADRLTYRIERRPLSRPTWEPVDASLEIVGAAGPVLRYATNRHMVGMYSASTPATGVEAELVSVGTGTTAEFGKQHVAGKMVLGDMSLGRLYIEAVRKRGAIGVLAYNMPSYTKPEVNRHSIQFIRHSLGFGQSGMGGRALLRGARGALGALAAGSPRVRVTSPQGSMPRRS